MEKEITTTCECGGVYLKKNCRRHEKSIKHQFFILKQRENEIINSHYKEWEPETKEALVYEYNPLQTDIKE
jgi:hypothetical protein